MRPCELQYTRLPCLSPTLGAYSNSCPSSLRCHPTVSSSVVPFSSCLQSFPTSGSFPMSQLFASGGQGIGASASASVLPMNIQDWFPLGWTGWISLQPKGLSRVFSTSQFKSINSLVLRFLYGPTLTSIKESWAPKNWCFWTVVLETPTLESFLGYKEIQPIHPKENQSWIFIGRTDAEAETPILWPPDAKNWPIGKDCDVGKDWRQEEKGTAEDEIIR